MRTVDELRTALIELGVDEKTVAGMRKNELTTKYQELTNPMDFAFEEAPSAEPIQTLESSIGVKYGSPEWTDYILSLFTSDELVDGCPKCNGMRRVAQLVLGNIVHSKAVNVIVLPTEPRSVTINYEVAIDWKLDTPIMFGNLNTPEDVRTFGGVADCIEMNTVFGRHPAATAESKAEARALRKALGINILTAEEKLSGQDDGPVTTKPTAPITKSLEQVILAKVKTLGLHISNVLSDFGFGSSKSLDNLSMEEARTLFDFINERYQRH